MWRPNWTPIIKNAIDEKQQRVLDLAESAQRKADLEAKLQRYSEYTFTPPSVEERIRQTAGQRLTVWAICLEAKPAAEI